MFWKMSSAKCWSFCLFLSVCQDYIHLHVHWNRNVIILTKIIHHWLHRKVSEWQLSVQPVMKISSKWQNFHVIVGWWSLWWDDVQSVGCMSTMCGCSDWQECQHRSEVKIRGLPAVTLLTHTRAHRWFGHTPLWRLICTDKQSLHLYRVSIYVTEKWNHHYQSYLIECTKARFLKGQLNSKANW